MITSTERCRQDGAYVNGGYITKVRYMWTSTEKKVTFLQVKGGF